MKLHFPNTKGGEREKGDGMMGGTKRQRNWKLETGRVSGDQISEWEILTSWPNCNLAAEIHIPLKMQHLFYI